MTTSDKKVIVGLYLKGTDLVPKELTATLGVEPTDSQVRGEARRTSSGHEFFTKTGLWALVIEQEPAEVMDIVEQLFARLGEQRSFATLSNVQEAYFDVFVAALSDKDGEGMCAMELTASQIAHLSRYGLPMRFTVTMGQP